MTQENPKVKQKTRKRIAIKTFSTFEEAKAAKETLEVVKSDGCNIGLGLSDKKKIVARWDGTYDVVWYQGFIDDVKVKVVDVTIATNGNAVTVAETVKKVKKEFNKRLKKPFVPKKFA